MSNKFKAEIKLYKNDLIYILTKLFEVSEDDVILNGAVFDEKGYICTVMKKIDFFSDLKDEKPEYVPRDTCIVNSPYIPYNPTSTVAPPILNQHCIITVDTPNAATSDPDPLKVTYDVDVDVTNEVT